MNISLNWLQNYWKVPSNVTVEDIARKLTFAGLEVEGVEDLSAGLSQVVVGEILEIKQHPNADRLSVTRIKVVASSDSAKELAVVCGASNIKVGQKIPVAVVGAKLPNGMEIKASKIRGEASQGMLCAHDELGLPVPEQAERGIFILDKKAQVGQSFAEYMDRGDSILDISVTPNRGDTLSHFGVARDLSALFGGEAKLPAVKVKEDAVSVQVELHNEVGEDSCGYFARYVEGVKVGPSPDWLVKKVESVGLRSINNVVDVSSFVMLEIGQPIHTFDADTLVSGDKLRVSVRSGVDKERFTTISHRELHLSPDDIVISAGDKGEKAAALAGVMGSDQTEVHAGTRNILIESAHFSPSRVRKTNRRYGLLTDAAYRFERGVDQARVAWAADRTAMLLQQVAGGKIGPLCAYKGTKIDSQPQLREISLSVEAVEACLGKSPPAAEITQILTSLGFVVKKAKGGSFICVVPSWRNDVTIPEDLIEEVARIWGFEHLESKLPLGFVPIKNETNEWEKQSRRLREHLCGLGYYEAINYAFSSHELELGVLGQDALKDMVELEAPIGQEYTLLKSSLIPGLLNNLRHNQHNQRSNVRLFEIRTCFRPGKPQKKQDPRLFTGAQESMRIGILLSGARTDTTWDGGDQVDFFTAKGMIESVFELFGRRGITFGSESLPEHLHPGQAANILLGRNAIGCVGRLHPRVERKFELSSNTYIAEIDLKFVLSNSIRKFKYKGYGKFPLVERDFSAVVKGTIQASEICEFVLKTAQPLGRSVDIFDIYQGDRVPTGSVSYAFRVVLGSDDHTLAESEISAVQAQIMDQLKAKFSAQFAGE